MESGSLNVYKLGVDKSVMVQKKMKNSVL